MGVSFSNQKKMPTETIINDEKKHNINEIIKRYEYIKQTKEICNIESILEIVKKY